MLAEEWQLGSAVNLRATDEVRNGERQVLMDCGGFGNIVDAKTLAAKAQPEIRKTGCYLEIG